MNATALLTEALLAIDAGDADAGGALIADAERGGSPLGRALRLHLGAPAEASVYDRPAAFGAFIRGGGNVGLYEAVGAAWAALYAERQPASLLDIGCGDGMATVPALGRSTHLLGRLDLLEPSAPLLDGAMQALQAAGLAERMDVRSWPMNAQAFFSRLGGNDHWDLAQASFALQALPAGERTHLFAALRSRATAVALVEFNVPPEPESRAEHVAALVQRYERGLAEYAGGQADLVGAGFLAPMLLGQLGPQRERRNWEQPASAWRVQLLEAGFRNVRVAPLTDYWWSPAFLMVAS